MDWRPDRAALINVIRLRAGINLVDPTEDMVRLPVLGNVVVDPAIETLIGAQRSQRHRLHDQSQL
jgi:hypothetical protein